MVLSSSMSPGQDLKVDIYDVGYQQDMLQSRLEHRAHNLLLSTVMNDDFISLRLTIPGRLRPVLYTLMLSVQPTCMKQELVDLTLLIHGIVASSQC